MARSEGSRHDLFPIAITAAEGEALRSWVIREGATRTIEIGLGYGLSALFIGGALLSAGDASARHVAVDPYQTTSFADCGLQLLEEAGLSELVEFDAEESQIALPRFLAEGRSFDFAFVDGNHRFDKVFLDVIYLGRLVRPGGVVFVDDYQLPAVVRAVAFCLTNLGWESEECPLRIVSISGRSSAPLGNRTPDRSTISSTSEWAPVGGLTATERAVDSGDERGRVLR